MTRGLCLAPGHGLPGQHRPSTAVEFFGNRGNSLKSAAGADSDRYGPSESYDRGRLWRKCKTSRFAVSEKKTFRGNE